MTRARPSRPWTLFCGRTCCHAKRKRMSSAAVTGSISAAQAVQRAAMDAREYAAVAPLDRAFGEPGREPAAQGGAFELDLRERDVDVRDRAIQGERERGAL